jgi:hypothetical protein
MFSPGRNPSGCPKPGHTWLALNKKKIKFSTRRKEVKRKADRPWQV